ncbi:nitroreductase/quinone reductase family protein [Pseudonocardia xinjiangensis]|uniref:Nitroreductase family deazaflavin-dependent oxidoreductase n=1 Tax=Pseudonocardia xinjiangensis TaxID=75289 RepID=A0ABX1REY8_9PSEU|nr:nitroreductase/quinone reductase family protein [Pseudonocardia xinjiangensis]NMH78577.1 nitroreductase family deazaflavin-dependent oxidoreductase [Pseudonocardia xinjiangensis]
MTDDLQEWNNRIVAEFRSNAGFVPWSNEEDLARGRPIPPLLPGFDPDGGVPIILVSHTGAATGRQRTNPLMYQAVSHAFAIFGTFGGSARPPAWYHNIVKNPDVTIEFRADVTRATARVAHGSERERIWSEQVRLMPAFADFEQAAGRQIPVVVLDPTQGAGRVDPPRQR